MIIFVDGPQMVGKTTLIGGLSKELGIRTLKFDFSRYSKELGVESGEGLKGFQAGKDLSALYYLSNLDIGENIIIDRGPLSTMYYSILFNRMNTTELINYTRAVSEFKDKFKFIFIQASNREVAAREKKDGYDKLEELVDLRGESFAVRSMEVFTNDYGIDVLQFDNDFSLPIETNVGVLILMMGERGFI